MAYEFGKVHRENIKPENIISDSELVNLLDNPSLLNKEDVIEILAIYQQNKNIQG